MVSRSTQWRSQKPVAPDPFGESPSTRAGSLGRTPQKRPGPRARARVLFFVSGRQDSPPGMVWASVRANCAGCGERTPAARRSAAGPRGGGWGATLSDIGLGSKGGPRRGGVVGSIGRA